MARIAIWLLAAVAALDLTSAVPVLGRKRELESSADDVTKRIRTEDMLVADGDRLISLDSLQGTPDDGQMEIDYPQFTVDLSNHVLAGGGPNNLVEESKSFSRDEMFASIRQYLGLPIIQGKVLHQYLVKSGNQGKFELVGLHTLLDGVQVPLRQMAYSSQLYLWDKRLGNSKLPDYFESTYPQLFGKYPFPDVTTLDFALPWINVQLTEVTVSPDRLKHSLFNLGRNLGVERTVGVIAAFFEVLRSDGLLNAFQVKVEQVQKEYDDSQNVEPPNQSSMTPDQVLALKYRAYVYRFWLEVIGNNNVNQLRYYLRNLLVFQVIPGIIGQVLESATHGNTVDHTKYTDALTLAKQIHQIPCFAKIAKTYRQNAPNYFEFILIYATERKLEGFTDYRKTIQKEGDVNMFLLYLCYMGYDPLSLWNFTETMIDIPPPAYPKRLHKIHEAKCNILIAKYQQVMQIYPEPLVGFSYITDEDTSDLLVPGAE